MKYLYITILLSLFHLSGKSQNRNILFDRVTLEEGLSQSNINCILQDKQGFLWFGTNGGLNKYKGTQFEFFLHHNNDSTSISNNIIQCLYEDKNGLIWIGTQNGINIFDPVSYTFKQLKDLMNDEIKLSHHDITAIAQDSIGNYWVTTNGGGLNKIDLTNQKIVTYQYAVQNPYTVSSNRLTSICIDNEGFIWVGSANNGLNMLKPDKGKFMRYMAEFDDSKLNSNSINCIYKDNDNVIWVGSAAGIHKVIPNKKGRSIKQRDYIIPYFKQLSVLDIYQGASGLLWFGTEKDGLWSFNKHNGHYSQYLSRSLDEKSLLSNKITTVLDDKSEILWIGTNAGINKIDRQTERFQLFTKEPSTSNSLSSNNVQALYKELNGTIWIGTFDGGLNKYDPLYDKYTIYTSKEILSGGTSLLNKNTRSKRIRKMQKRQLISNDRILALYRDRHHTLWIGTGGSGLDKMNVNTGIITHYPANKLNKDSLSGNIVNTIFEDHNGMLWIGTKDGGLNSFDRAAFKRYVHNENDVLSISSNYITDITEDKKGRLWVGTFGGGLNLLNKSNNTFSRFNYGNNSTSELSSNAIYCLHADDSSNLWIGTSNGLDVIHLDSMNIDHFTLEDGLPSNFIYGILPDGNGNLWISTNKGISKFNIAQRQFKNFDKKDGLQGNEFNPGAYYKTRRGEMLFGGIHGFNTFYPKNVKDNNYKPDIIITDIKILNQKVPIGTPESPLKKHISVTKEIILEHNQNFINLEFISLNYTDPEKNQYKYYLDNFDDGWNEVGNRNFANYTNLPPGEYIFHVNGSNNDNIWNENGAQLKIIINPPFWETWWFGTVLVTIVLGAIYIFIRKRELSLIKSRMILRQQVKARTEQLTEEKTRVEKAHAEILFQKNEIENQQNLLIRKNKELTEAKSQLDFANEELKGINSHLEEIVTERTDKLKHTNERLRISNHELETFIYRASHDLRGPIARLLGLTMIAKLDNNPDYILKIEENAVNMNQLLDKLTHIHWILKEQINLQPIHFYSFLEDIWQSVDLNGADNNIQLKCHFKKETYIHSDETHLRIILKNLLENAVIFRNKNHKTLIECFLHQDEQHYCIEIIDNGIGISEIQVGNIFKMFVKASDQSKGNGLGLYLVQKAVEKLLGKIEVLSVFERQTRFTIKIPLQEKSFIHKKKHQKSSASQ